jgi:folate-binding protein YgfZ
VNSEWQAWLRTKGAVFDADVPCRFGDCRDEIRAAASGTVIAALTRHGLIRAEGADATTFLQGQLSNDIAALQADRHQLAAYCTPKGRMLALFRVFRRDGYVYLASPMAIRDAVLPRLRMYVMRAAASLSAADDVVAIGLSGPEATPLLETHLGATPPAPDGAAIHDGVHVLTLPGPLPRYECYGPLARIQRLWESCATSATPVGDDAWAWLDIQAGIPQIYTETVEAFVPQMANLDAINGISFKKGCYPGQEIVARMRYLGKLKQRMYRAHVAGDAPIAPGTSLYASDFGDQSAGTVVLAQPAPESGIDLLAILQISSAEGGEVHAGSPDGPRLAISAVPYSLPEEDQRRERTT